jgi:hypothetical protein
MNSRNSSPALDGASWRRRFVAIARQAEAAGPRPPAPAGLRIRLRQHGAAGDRRFGVRS